MAINPGSQYPGKTTAPDAEHPYGGAQNITVPGDATGTPWEAALVADLFGLQQALLIAAGIVPSGTPDEVTASQYLQALVELAAGRADIYDDTGIADAYVLDIKANQEAPQSYFDGMRVRFIPGNVNTGASTVNVAGLGIKVIKRQNGVTLIAGDIKNNEENILSFDNSNDWFIISKFNGGTVGNVLNIQAGIVLNNDKSLSGKDTGDTSFNLVEMTSSNQVRLGTASKQTLLEGAFIDINSPFYLAQGVSIPSATTTDLNTATGNSPTITGVVTITSFGTVLTGAMFYLTFSGALIITHNGTSLILPGAADITTEAGDVAVMKSLGGGNWKCMSYQRAANPPVVNPLLTKVIEIGDWNMDTTASVSVAHGLTYSDIRTIDVLLQRDTGSIVIPLDYTASPSLVDGNFSADATNIIMNRTASPGGFDNTGYDATSFNRGWITIQYVN